MRLHSLDAARAIALLLGLVTHATGGYAVYRGADALTSDAMSATHFGLHNFRMTLFFVIAGLFARMALKMHGTRAFAADRRRRVLVPLIVGWFVLTPAILAAFLLDHRLNGAVELGSAAVETGGRGLTLFHLWFLYYLLLFYAVAIVLSALAKRMDPSGERLDRLDSLFRELFRPWTLIVLALPLGTVLHASRVWELRAGLYAPESIPDPTTFLAYGSAFTVGWWLERNLNVLDTLRASWATNLIVAIILTGVCLGMIGVHPTPITALPGFEGSRLLYVACYAAAAWYWSAAVLGMTARFCAVASARWRYIADASYWLYLLHLPVELALVAVFRRLDAPWFILVPGTVLTTFVLLLVTYDRWVRPTVVGQVLNGAKRPPALARLLRPVPSPAA